MYSFWFEQFNFPNELELPYKNNGGLLNKNYYKIKIPSNWKIESFMKNSLFSNIKPGIVKYDLLKNYFSTSEVNGNIYSYGIDVLYSRRESRANMQPIPCSVWFAKMKNSIKHIAFEDDSKLIDEIILSTGFLGLKCHEYSFEYIWCLINSSWFETQKDYIASGSTQEAISDSNIDYIKIIVPPNEILKKFHKLTHNDLKLIYKLLYENLKLESTIEWYSKQLLSKSICL